MEEETSTNNDSLPGLRELESKIGRKTPESLLIWMKDAADCEDRWGSDAVDLGEGGSACSDTFSDRISNLKQEMRWLRSADVRILRQLVVVHEGIEAMRWLMEERDALASRGSSLTGSLSSLVTMEEHGPSMSPCRENLSPTRDLFDESEDQPSRAELGDSHNIRCLDRLSPQRSRPYSLSTSDAEFARSTHDRHGQAPSSPVGRLVRGYLPKSRPHDSDAGPSQDIRGGADAIRRALLRSSLAKREVKVESGGCEQSEETQEGSQNNTMKSEDSPTDRETGLLGYDAQWCWVESQDDVTFL